MLTYNWRTIYRVLPPCKFNWSLEMHRCVGHACPPSLSFTDKRYSKLEWNDAKLDIYYQIDILYTIQYLVILFYSHLFSFVASHMWEIKSAVGKYIQFHTNSSRELENLFITVRTMYTNVEHISMTWSWGHIRQKKKLTVLLVLYTIET